MLMPTLLDSPTSMMTELAASHIVAFSAALPLAALSLLLYSKSQRLLPSIRQHSLTLYQVQPFACPPSTGWLKLQAIYMYIHGM
jgi:hypothetical protein